MEGGEGPGGGPPLRPLCIHAANLPLTAQEAAWGSVTTCEAETRRGGRLGSELSGSGERALAGNTASAEERGCGLTERGQRGKDAGGSG